MSGAYRNLEKVRKKFPELKGHIEMTYHEGMPFARVEVSRFISIIPTNTRIVVSLSRSTETWSDKSKQGLIAHELAHLVCDGDEEQVSKEAINRGFYREFQAMFKMICPVYCGGRKRTELGGLPCELFCPHRKRIKNVSRTRH